MIQKQNLLFITTALFVIVVCCILASRTQEHFTQSINTYQDCMAIPILFSENPMDTSWLNNQSKREKKYINNLTIRMQDSTDQTIKDEVQTILSTVGKLRVKLRKIGWGLLEGSRTRGVDGTPLNGCTFRPQKPTLFNASSNQCTINIEDSTFPAEEDVTVAGILKPTKPDQVMSIENIDTCYAKVPSKSEFDTMDDNGKTNIREAILDILEVVGAKVSQSVQNEIKMLQVQIDILLEERSSLNDRIPKQKSTNERTSQDVERLKRDIVTKRFAINRTLTENKTIMKDISKLQEQKQYIVEVFEHCNYQGKRRVYQIRGEKNKTISFRFSSQISSIRFPDNRFTIIVSKLNGSRAILTKSSPCLVDAQGQGNFNDQVSKIQIVSTPPIPNKGYIKSAGLQGYTLHATPGNNNAYESYRGLSLVTARKHQPNDPRQMWTYDSRSKQLKPSVDSRRCLDPPYAGTADDTPLIHYPCHGGDNMKFELNTKGQLINARNAPLPRKCLEVLTTAENVPGPLTGYRSETKTTMHREKRTRKKYNIFRRRTENQDYFVNVPRTNITKVPIYGQAVPQYKVVLRSCNDNNLNQKWIVENP